VRGGPEIPELPQKSSHKSSEHPAPKPTPVSSFHVFPKRLITQPDIHGLKEKNETQPGKRKKEAGPGHEEKNEYKSGNKKDFQEGRRRAKLEKSELLPFHKTLDEKSNLHHRRYHCGESNEITQPSQRQALRKALVAPVLQFQVENLEDQPDKDGDKSCEQKIPKRSRKKRTPSPPVIQTVHNEDE
jgi:hypothetical protein